MLMNTNATLPSPSLCKFDIWGGLGIDCVVDGFNYMGRTMAISAIPIAIVCAIW